MLNKKWFIYYEYMDDDLKPIEKESPFFTTKKEALNYLSSTAKKKTVTKTVLLTIDKKGTVKKKNEKNFIFFYVFCLGVFLSVLFKVFN